jgi:hypothetical protein
MIFDLGVKKIEREREEEREKKKGKEREKKKWFGAYERGELQIVSLH